ncbi:MAG TPA: amino acid transporter [Candidatus Dormibacteraeota bacterium]|nr:amino acid transporter [Candidatus Dormibacteraeota bacterium]
MNKTQMEAADVVAVGDVLADARVTCWLDGGWGVDALVGRQTRPHEDLDLVIAVDDVATAIEALQAVGFPVEEDLRPVSFTMCTPDGRKVDFHPVTWDEHGGGVQAQPNNSSWTYPAEGFRGVGQVAGHPVRCLTADVQILCHAGYQLDAGDLHDLGLLRSLQHGPGTR